MNIDELRVLGGGIKAIVCDLDQTLLNSHKQISPTNLEAIHQAQEKGIFVTICSGRIFTMLEAYVKDLSIEGPVISTNGAAIVDSNCNKVLWSRPIDRQLAMQILDFAKEHSYDYSALTGDACYFSKNSIRIERFLQYNQIAVENGLAAIPIEYFENDHQVVNGDIYKILIFEIHPGDFEEASVFLKTVDGIDFTSSEEGLLDVMAAGVDKGVGVAQLREIMGIHKNELCVFGDYLNDLPMFLEAGFPIAMENACDSVKEAALAIADHFDRDGIAKAIYKYIL